MKKTLIILLLLSCTVLSLMADVTESPKILDMYLDLTSSSSDFTPKYNIGFWNSLDPDTFSDETSVTADTKLNLESSMASGGKGNSFALIGTGTTYVYWQILSAEKFTASLSSLVLSLDSTVAGSIDSTRKEIPWSTSWKAKAQNATTSDTHKDITEAVEEGDLISFGSSNSYDSSKVFTHDGSVSLGSWGYVKLPITTEDASGKVAGKYKTTLTLTITTESAGTEGTQGGSE